MFKLDDKKTNDSFSADWLKLNDAQRAWYDSKGILPIRVQAPKGALVLWDSRTIHANSTAQLPQQPKTPKKSPKSTSSSSLPSSSSPTAISSKPSSSALAVELKEEGEGEEVKQDFRHVIYVCYTPRKFATDVALAKKQKYYHEGRMTSHWPHHIKVFGEQPNFYSAAERKKWAPGLAKMKALFKPAQLTDLGKRLAGFP